MRAAVQTLAMPMPAELAVIVPTFNEAANVDLLIQAVSRTLGSIRWEIVFVDDNSPDGTSDLVREIASSDARVRIVHRFGRRGLSSACVEGILATSAPFIAIMDGDMQHDEGVLVAMLARLKESDLDLVVGSRYVDGGSFGEWSRKRVLASQIATKLALKLTRTALSDPMSGFFMLRREAFMAALPNLSNVGFKILLDIAASTPKPLRVAEVPFTFRTRQHGESKLDALVLWEYLQLILDKALGHIVPARFISFAMVGGIGLLVHFAVLTLLFKGVGLAFAIAQTGATIFAISNNFFLNNILTYSDQRLRGLRLLYGWITFNLVCAVGAAANVGIADWLFERPTYWVVSALAGILVSVVWNYVVSGLVTWRKR